MAISSVTTKGWGGVMPADVTPGDDNRNAFWNESNRPSAHNAQARIELAIESPNETTTARIFESGNFNVNKRD